MAIVTRQNFKDGTKSNYKEGQANIYKFKAEMTVLTDGDPIEIAPENIKAVVVDHDFKTQNMPLIYITLNISKKDGDKIIKNQDKYTISFKLSKGIVTAEGEAPSFFSAYISDEFVYFISSDINKDDQIDYEGQDEGRDDIWNNIIIGLMSRTLLNSNRKELNGVLNGTLSSNVYNLLKHRPLLMEPFQHNKMIQNEHLPPVNSVAKYLKFFNSLQAFYDTVYRYYMDFDCTYLLSSSGKVLQKEGEEIVDHTIKLINAFEVPMDGLMIDNENKLYYTEAEGNETYLHDGHSVDKSYSNIKAVGVDGSISNGSSVNNLSSYMSSKTIYIRLPNSNKDLLNNKTTELKTGAVQMAIFVQDVDPSVFTLNKKYTIDVNEVYDPAYNGTYILNRKRELYIREDTTFSLGLTLSFEKVS